MTSYNKTYYELNRMKFKEYMKKYYDNNKIEISEQKKKYYENSRNDILEQKKKYYEISRNHKIDYNFYHYYKNKYDLSNEIIDILYSIKENNKIKKFRNIYYYIALSEIYNIVID